MKKKKEVLFGTLCRNSCVVLFGNFDFVCSVMLYLVKAARSLFCSHLERKKMKKNVGPVIKGRAYSMIVEGI